MLYSKSRLVWQKRKKRVVSIFQPKRNVSIGSKSELQNIIYIDFNKYPKWTSSVQIGSFTNHFKNSEQALKYFFFIVDQLIPSIEDYGADIFSGKAKHCHRLTGQQQELALKTIKEIHGTKILDKEKELWQLTRGHRIIRTKTYWKRGHRLMAYPKKRDIVIIDAEPHSSKEYGGHDPKNKNIRRYMVIVSFDAYNKATGMIVGMPITTNPKYQNNPRYTPIFKSGNEIDGVKGFIALWQLQNFDFNSRHGVVVNSLTDKEYKQLIPYIRDMLGLS